MILAIETSSLVCGASLHSGGECISENYLEQARVHAEKLAGIVRDLLEEQKIRIQKLDAVAVSAGPGSFTGLRIGMSFAKGLVYPHRIPLAAVNSMKAFIAGNREEVLPGKKPVWVIHSHRDNIYAAELSEPVDSVKIRYGKTEDLAIWYPECKQIVSNADIDVPGVTLIKKPILPSVIGNYYVQYMPGEAVTDYESLALEYGMNYKPKEWGSASGKNANKQ